MGKDTYMIKKIFLTDGKKQHVILTNGGSEVYESTKRDKMDEFVEVLNENTDNGCFYEVITIKNK